MSECDKGGRCPVCNGRSSMLDEQRCSDCNGILTIEEEESQTGMCRRCRRNEDQGDR